MQREASLGVAAREAAEQRHAGRTSSASERINKIKGGWKISSTQSMIAPAPNHKAKDGLDNTKGSTEARRRSIERILISDAESSGLCSILCNSHCETGHWVDSNQFKVFICTVVIFNAGYVGMTALEEEQDEGELVGWDSKKVVFFFIECAFLFIFTLELTLRFRARGMCEFLRDSWNYFDFGLVVANYLEVITSLLQFSQVGNLTAAAAILRVLRVVRLMRVFQIIRLFRFVDELQLLLKGMLSAVRTLVWSMGMLFTLIYIVALLLTKYVGQVSDLERTRYFFGTLPRSMFTLFTFVTLEGWPDTARHLMDAEPWGAFLVIVIMIFILFSNLALLNLVTAVLVESVVGIANADDKKRMERFEKERRETVKKLAAVFGAMDEDGDGELSLEEFQEGVQQNKVIRQMMYQLSIDSNDAEELFHIIDFDGDEKISAIEFIEGAMMCRAGDAVSRHMLGFHYDMRKYFQVLGEAQDEMLQMLATVGRGDDGCAVSIPMMSRSSSKSISASVSATLRGVGRNRTKRMTSTASMASASVNVANPLVVKSSTMGSQLSESLYRGKPVPQHFINMPAVLMPTANTPVGSITKVSQDDVLSNPSSEKGIPRLTSETDLVDVEKQAAKADASDDEAAVNSLQSLMSLPNEPTSLRCSAQPSRASQRPRSRSPSTQQVPPPKAMSVTALKAEALEAALEKTLEAALEKGLEGKLQAMEQRLSAAQQQSAAEMEERLTQKLVNVLNEHHRRGVEGTPDAAAGNPVSAGTTVEHLKETVERLPSLVREAVAQDISEAVAGLKAEMQPVPGPLREELVEKLLKPFAGKDRDDDCESVMSRCPSGDLGGTGTPPEGRIQDLQDMAVSLRHALAEKVAKSPTKGDGDKDLRAASCADDWIAPPQPPQPPVAPPAPAPVQPAGSPAALTVEPPSQLLPVHEQLAGASPLVADVVSSSPGMVTQATAVSGTSEKGAHIVSVRVTTTRRSP